MPDIVTSGLRKVYTVARKGPGLAGAVKGLVRPNRQRITAVEALDLAVERGEIVGYIGPNGAGKSTTIKMLTGILTPSSGSVRVLGRDPHRQRVANARDIGVVFGQRSQLWWDLPVRESLSTVARMYGIDRERFARVLSDAVEILEIGELLHQPLRTLSLGQRMRVELAATLVHLPKVLYLDEPTVGLDLIARDRIRELVRTLNEEQGLTVFLTSHDIADIETVCRRVVVLDRGRVVYDGPREAMAERFARERTVTFETAGEVAELDLPPGCSSRRDGERRLSVTFDRRSVSASAVAAAVLARTEVVDMRIEEPDLEAVVKQIYRSQRSEGAST